jgi:hypothetical protein
LPLPLDSGIIGSYQTSKVFFSYSHDSPEHEGHVLAGAARLRKDGLNAQLDQYIAGSPAGHLKLFCGKAYCTRLSMTAGPADNWQN